MTNTADSADAVTRPRALVTWLYLVAASSSAGAVIWTMTSAVAAPASGPASPSTSLAQACFTTLVIACTVTPLLVYTLAWPSTPHDWAVLASAGAAVVATVVMLVVFGYFAVMFGFVMLINGTAKGVMLMLSPLVTCAPLIGMLIALVTVALRAGRRLRFRNVALIVGVVVAIALGGTFTLSAWGQL